MFLVKLRDKRFTGVDIEIAGMVRSQLKPKLLLWLCVDALVREKIEVPSYTRLTKLILGAINRRNETG